MKLNNEIRSPLGLAHVHGQLIVIGSEVAAPHTGGAAVSVKAPHVHLLQAAAPPPPPILLYLPLLLQTN